jgi:glutamate dehydrogenase
MIYCQVLLCNCFYFMQNPFENARTQLRRAALVTPISETLINRLMHPDREIRVSIPVKMDDGTERIFEGYRVQHNNARGPYKGGIRFHQDADIYEVKALALWMSLKCAVAGIPMGGGKGGITVDPKTLSASELERLSRGWVIKMADVLGPYKDVPAPDVNTNGQIMGWMTDEYYRITGDKTRATFTGKLLEDGGSKGRPQATGLGGFYVFSALRDTFALPSCAHVVIQGFGNVGGYAADFWSQAGDSIVGVSDSRGGVYDPNGLDLASVRAHKEATGSVVGYNGLPTLSQQELLEMECDVLIPAALENQITQENASRIKARVVVELANGPTTPEADDILFERGIVVLPDILANAGGVTVSTFEWQQNLEDVSWSESEVLERLKGLLQREAVEIHTLAKELVTDIRRAAYVTAIRRIGQALEHSQ